MSQTFLKLIQTGATAEVADAVGEHPALARYRDPQGVSALMWSIYYGQTMIRDYLLAQLAAQGAELDVFEAAAVGDTNRLEEFSQLDAEALQSFSSDGWTPLHLASAFAPATAVALLLDHGARADAVSKNPQRNQPLHAAVALGPDMEKVRLLLAHGANVNAVQAGGFTPLFSVAAANRRDLTELLLAHGANAHSQNEYGKTAAEFARERGHTEMAAWLESQST